MKGPELPGCRRCSLDRHGANVWVKFIRSAGRRRFHQDFRGIGRRSLEASLVLRQTLRPVASSAAAQSCSAPPSPAKLPLAALAWSAKPDNDIMPVLKWKRACSAPAAFIAATWCSAPASRARRGSTPAAASAAAATSTLWAASFSSVSPIKEMTASPRHKPGVGTANNLRIKPTDRSPWAFLLRGRP